MIAIEKYSFWNERSPLKISKSSGIYRSSGMENPIPKQNSVMSEVLSNFSPIMTQVLTGKNLDFGIIEQFIKILFLDHSQFYFFAILIELKSFR